MGYRIIRKDHEIIMLDEDSTYQLVFCSSNGSINDHSRGLMFRASSQALSVTALSPDIGITTRDIDRYQVRVDTIPINPQFQYIEVGAGLGGFMEYLVETLDGQLCHRPIVIDPANYELMIKMLESGRKIAQTAGRLTRLERVLKRAKLMVDSSRINLINTTLQDAVNRQPELHHCADVVVESWGPSLYEDESVKVEELKRCLCKTNGNINGAGKIFGF